MIYHYQRLTLSQDVAPRAVPQPQQEPPASAASAGIITRAAVAVSRSRTPHPHLSPAVGSTRSLSRGSARPRERQLQQCPPPAGASRKPRIETASNSMSHRGPCYGCSHCPLQQEQQPQLPPAQSRNTKSLRPPSAAVATFVTSRMIHTAAQAPSREVRISRK